MAECCSEIGTLGIVLLVISLVISVAFGVLCIVGGIFVWRRQTLFKVWGEDQQKERWSYVISTGELSPTFDSSCPLLLIMCHI